MFFLKTNSFLQVKYFRLSDWDFCHVLVEYRTKIRQTSEMSHFQLWTLLQCSDIHTLSLIIFIFSSSTLHFMRGDRQTPRLCHLYPLFLNANLHCWCRKLMAAWRFFIRAEQSSHEAFCSCLCSHSDPLTIFSQEPQTPAEGINEGRLRHFPACRGSCNSPIMPLVWERSQVFLLSKLWSVVQLFLHRRSACLCFPSWFRFICPLGKHGCLHIKLAPMLTTVRVHFSWGGGAVCKLLSLAVFLLAHLKVSMWPGNSFPAGNAAVPLWDESAAGAPHKLPGGPSPWHGACASSAEAPLQGRQPWFDAAATTMTEAFCRMQSAAWASLSSWRRPDFLLVFFFRLARTEYMKNDINQSKMKYEHRVHLYLYLFK